MEDTHRRTIRKNLAALVQSTNYQVLIRYLRENDKCSVIPEACMRKWLTRLDIPEWTPQRRTSEFYEEIQKRGPDAFALLISALSNTGHQHQELARLLDPSISDEQYSDSEPLQEIYNEAGENCLFIDDSWEQAPCSDDREAIKRMFIDFGFVLKEKLPPSDADVASCVVVNFHAFRNDGVVQRDEEWIHQHFLNSIFDNKPKILLSLRYKTSNARRIETDSALGRHPRAPYNDILWVKIYLDPSNISSDQENTCVSKVVEELIKICKSDTTSDFPRLMNKLNERLDELRGYDPIELEKWGFGKSFFLKKM